MSSIDTFSSHKVDAFPAVVVLIPLFPVPFFLFGLLICPTCLQVLVLPQCGDQNIFYLGLTVFCLWFHQDDSVAMHIPLYHSLLF